MDWRERCDPALSHVHLKLKLQQRGPISDAPPSEFTSLVSHLLPLASVAQALSRPLPFLLLLVLLVIVPAVTTITTTLLSHQHPSTCFLYLSDPLCLPSPSFPPFAPPTSARLSVSTVHSSTAGIPICCSIVSSNLRQYKHPSFGEQTRSLGSHLHADRGFLDLPPCSTHSQRRSSPSRFARIGILALAHLHSRHDRIPYQSRRRAQTAVETAPHYHSTTSIISISRIGLKDKLHL